MEKLFAVGNNQKWSILELKVDLEGTRNGLEGQIRKILLLSLFR